jgi:ABC-2 type transport system permease protein
LTFISSIWFPSDTLPKWLKDIASIFPIKSLAEGLQYVFDPRHSGGGVSTADIRNLAIWTVIGIVLMVRFLRQPQGEVA